MSFFSSRRQVELPPTPSQTGERPPAVTVAAQQPIGFETVLGANSVMEGHLRSTANIRLDGTFTGTLEISGNVLVGETARITADINGRNLSIAGAVRGNVSGKKVQILRTGRIWGDIHAQALTTEEGAFIDGKITMTRSDITEESAPPPPPALVTEDVPEAELPVAVTPIDSTESEAEPTVSEIHLTGDAPAEDAPTNEEPRA